MGCTSENAKLTNVLAIVERLLPTRFRLFGGLTLSAPRFLRVAFFSRSRPKQFFIKGLEALEGRDETR